MTDFANLRTMMVDTQIRPSDVTKYPIISAFLEVPREAFVPATLQDIAYSEHELRLNATSHVLEARAFAKLLDALHIETQDAVLDLGAAQGYSTAVLSRMAAFVVGITQEDLAHEGQAKLTELGYDNAVLQAGEAVQGAAAHGPFDVIIVQGAVQAFPQNLMDQLNESGRIGAFFDVGGVTVARIGRKINGQVHWDDIFESHASPVQGFEQRAEFAL